VYDANGSARLLACGRRDPLRPCLMPPTRETPGRHDEGEETFVLVPPPEKQSSSLS
jgi:hypothetical protein